MYEMIKLTMMNDDPIYCRVYYIKCVYRDQESEYKNKTLVEFAGSGEDYVHVKESPEEVIKMIGRVCDQSLHVGQF